MDSVNLPVTWLLGIGAAWLLWRWSHVNTVDKVVNNLPGPPSHSWWKGNVEQFFHRHGHEFQKQVALNYGSVVKLDALFGNKMLYVSDAKALHTILVKEEQIFEETPSFTALNTLMFGPGLTSSSGDRHRRQRKMLNPVFSVNHMRHMLPIFYKVVHKLRDAVSTEIINGQNEIDMLGWMGRTALELIGQGGLGYSFDPLVENVKNDYGDALKALLPSLMGIEMLRRLAPFVYKMGPSWLRRLVVEKYPNENVQKMKSSIDMMSNKSEEIYESKKAALAKGDEAMLKQLGEGKDIMSILIRANSTASEADKLPEDELVAQMSTLIFAAMDTTSNSLSRILHVLAEHRDVQEKLRLELLEANAADGLTYDELNRLPLLDAVCRETLRVYPPVTILLRVPTKDTVLPLSAPIIGVDGNHISEVPIAKGTDVIIGTYGSNMNKALWGEDALEWKPERWLKPLPEAVTNAPIPAVYSNLMTFLGGKRACIGFKFSEMEMKVVLAVLLSSFTVEMSDKPIEWNVAGVWYPTVGKQSDQPQLPMKLSLYKGPKS